MNEHDNLTPAEMESYRSALNEAYPQPKSDIHAGVMKAIRAERLLQKKRARRAAFVKWGSVAACLAIVCLVGWKVIPGTDRLAPMAENDSAEGYNLSKAYDLAPCEADAVDQSYGVEEDQSVANGNQSVANGNQSPSVYSYSAEGADIGRINTDIAGDLGTAGVPSSVSSTNAEDEKAEETDETEEEPKDPRVVSK